MTSTCDSAGSIANPPPESDLDDERIRTMLASPLYHVVEREGKGQSSGVQDFAGERSTGDTRSAAFCGRIVLGL